MHSETIFKTICVAVPLAYIGAMTLMSMSNMKTIVSLSLVGLLITVIFTLIIGRFIKDPSGDGALAFATLYFCVGFIANAFIAPLLYLIQSSATITLVVWGCIHGLVLFIYKFTKIISDE